VAFLSLGKVWDPESGSGHPPDSVLWPEIVVFNLNEQIMRFNGCFNAMNLRKIQVWRPILNTAFSKLFDMLDKKMFYYVRS